MKSEYTAKFRMVDEMSAAMVRLGDTGVNAIVDVEKSSVRLDSALLNTSKSSAEAAASLSKLSGNSTGAVTPSRLLADAMSDQARKLEQAAEKARNKANIDAQAAAEAKRFHESLKSQLMTVDKVTDSMNDEVVQAQKTSESLEKVAQKSEKKAKKAEEAAAAARKNASATEASAQAEEKMYAASNKAANAEQKVADALNKSEREAKEYGEALQKASGESETLGNKAANAGELIQDAFATIGVVAALNKIKDGFVSAASAAIEFESAVTGVYKTVDGTEEQLAEISSDIKEMSLVIPSSTTEIAGVAESAGQLGIATENITDFTEVMINLGESTNLSSEQAASSLAKFSNITNMSADNYENLGSAIVALGNNFATTEADIVEMSTRMASAGTLAGMSESDILGLSAAMSSVGIEAEAGGSAMSKLMTDIQVAVETGNSSLEDFASVAGVSCEQFSDMFEHRAVDALYSFIDGLNDVERNGETATVILENMGISEVRLSNAVKSLANNSSGLAGAVSLAGEAWEENTALANEANTRYGTLESRLTMTQNAANNLKIAIGDTLTPTIGAFADMGTSALTWMTDFAEKHPVVVEGITGITVAGAGFIGTVTVAAAAVKALNVVTNTFNLTLSKTKVGLIIGGVATAGAAIGGLIHHFNSAEDAVEDYNGTLEQCRIEIDSTETAYANVCKLYGENSEAAKSLSKELDTLNAQYEKGGGFVSDYEQRLAESQETLKSFITEYDNKMTKIDGSWQSGMIAVAQLDALSDKAQITNTDLDLMADYADYLNDTFNCNIEVDYDTGELTGFDPNSVIDQLTEKAEENRINSAAESLTSPEFTNGYIDILKEKKEIEQEYAVVKNEILKAMNDPSAVNTTGFTLDEAEKEFSEKIAKAEGQIIEYENTARKAFDTMGTPESADSFLDNLENMADDYGNLGQAAEEANNAILTPQDAARDAMSEVSDEILELSEAYDGAYICALESFQGQFGLFDEAQANAEATVYSAQAAMDSQLEYWNQYGENISYLANTSAESLGITQGNYDALMSYVQSGSEEAAGLADSIVYNIENGNSEAVANLANTIGEVSSKQGEIADTTAVWITDYEQKLGDYVKTAEDKIAEMDLSKDAKKSAINTVNAYASAILAQKDSAVSAANSLVSEVQAVFNNSKVTYTLPEEKGDVSVYGPAERGYATGTLSAEPGIALVGEEGPELINFRGGEAVYTTDETEKILNGFAERSLYVPPAKSFSAEKFDANSETVSKKEISLDITGKGSVNIQSNMSKEQVVSILSDYIKPVLMGIVEQEIFEEGESFYEI
ncbi:MAG: phage tail tape measure protein [Oscillospiraceae bacterium]